MIESYEIDFYTILNDVYIRLDGAYRYGVDHTTNEMSLMKSTRDKDVLATTKRDIRQVETFNTSRFKLIRVTDKEFDVVKKVCYLIQQLLKSNE